MSASRFGASMVTRGAADSARIASTLAAGLVAATSACGAEAPAPWGEVHVAVETDVDVDRAGFNHLRVDVFDEGGSWLASRDYPRGDRASAWPSTFSLFTTDPSLPSRVLVRLRLFPGIATRDYLGERFEEPPVGWQPPAAARSFVEACASGTSLDGGRPVTLRIGASPLGSSNNGCWARTVVQSGAAVAWLTVPRTGPDPVPYRIEVQSVDPTAQNVALVVRSDCTNPATKVACLDDTESEWGGDGRPSLVTALEPGTYAAIVFGLSAGGADVVLRAAPVATWSPPETITQRNTDRAPRLVVADTDVTPRTEPDPGPTIDRLVALTIRPGVRETAQITLRGVCAGTMAQLGDPSEPWRVDLSRAQTCVDTERTRVPVSDAPTVAGIVDPTPLPPAAETGCADAATPPTDDSVCVPSGTFTLGDPRYASVDPVSTGPMKLARMSAFWMDRHEVSVGAWRAALADGFVPSASPYANEGPLAIAKLDTGLELKLCSWSAAARDREDHPITCLTWTAAREYCQFRGGDLPTEAQWEYAATHSPTPASDHGVKRTTLGGVRYATSDRCDGEALERFQLPDSVGICFAATPGEDGAHHGFGPLPVDARGHAGGDVTDLGIVHMGGNVREYVRDALEGFGHPCWRTASYTDPACDQPDAPMRGARGGSFALPQWARTLTLRHPGQVGEIDIDSSLGFRCAYATR